MENATGSCTARSHSSFSNASRRSRFNRDTGTLRPSSRSQETSCAKNGVPPVLRSCSTHRSSVTGLFRAASGGGDWANASRPSPSRTDRHTGSPACTVSRNETGTRWHSWRYRFRSSENTASVAPVTSSLVRVPNISRPNRPSRYPVVNPERENTAPRLRIRSGGRGWPSAASRQACVAAATYSGRFMRPSIFALTTPACASSPMRSIMDRSFRLRSCPVPPGAENGRRHGWAHNPRLPLRAPSMELK